MDKGKLIYRDRSGKLAIYIFLLFGITFNLNLFLSENKPEFVIFIITNVFFVLLPLKIIQTINCNPGFYENGVGYFKNNRCTHFVPYHQFDEIECFVTRKSIKSPSQTPTYGITFYKIGEESVKITFNSVKPLKEKWASILKQNPYLNGKLTTPKSTDSAYEVTPHSEERQQLSTLINQKAYHPASELLFNTLNQI